MTAQAAYPEGTLKLKTGWGWVLVAGILFVIVGVLAVLQPLITGLAVGIYLGASFIVAGAFAAASGVVNIRQRGAWLFIILGILAMIAGAYMALLPLNAAVSLVWAIGVWMIVAGAFELYTATQIRLHRAWMIFIGLVDVALGLVLLWIDPVSAIEVLAWMVGFSFVMRGIASIVFSGELRKLSQL
jgi:uncharacterized membrane protein HdeD (DUF308 family)